MSAQIAVLRRTFAAKALPAGPERVAANASAVTSEYMPSYRFCYAAVHPVTGARFSLSFRTKAEAEQDAIRSAALGYAST